MVGNIKRNDSAPLFIIDREPKPTTVVSDLKAKRSEGSSMIGSQVPITADPPTSARVLTTATTKPRMTAGDKVTIADIAKTFGADAQQGKNLRLSRHQGQPRLHLFEGGAGNRLLDPIQRKKQHAEAVGFVQQAIDRELGKRGAGENLLRELKLGQDGKLAAADLDKVANAVRRLGNERSAQTEWAKAETSIVERGDVWTKGRKAHLVNWSPQNEALAAKQFKTGTLGLEGATKVKVSDGGAGGVIFATRTAATGAKTGVVLKIEHENLLARAAFVSGLAEVVEAKVKSPLPFDMPRHELVKLDSVKRGELGDTIEQLKSGNERDRSSAARFERDLERSGGAISRYELLEGAQLTELPLMDRIGLVKGGLLADDLGRATVLMPVFGLNDHLTPEALSGHGNLGNLFMGADGRLKVIDLSTAGGEGRKFGYTDAEVLKGYRDIVATLQRTSSIKEGASALADIVQDAKSLNTENNAFQKVFNAVLEKNGILSGSLFDRSEAATVDALVDDADMKTFAVGTLRGAIEGLIYLRDNIDAFRAAHSQLGEQTAITDPNATFGDLRKMLTDANLEGMQSAMRMQHGHLTPALNF